MRFKRVRVSNYRNIELANLPFDSPRVFVQGRNAQGKTNLLESLGYVSALQAFRARENAKLIGPKAPFAELSFDLETEELGEQTVRVRIKPKGKEVMVDGAPIRRASEFSGRFPAVVLASNDLQLARGSPGDRRRYLDTFLCGVDRGFGAALQTYHQLLKERNALLKSQAPTALLSAFERQMAGPAHAVYAGRAKGVADLLALAAPFHASFAQGNESLKIEYKPSAELDSPEAYRELLDRNRKRDALLQTTYAGPHRDDFKLLVDDRAADHFASEGQQRTIVLALSFAMVAYWRERYNVSPVILADDTLGELDPDRRRAFWSALDGDLQVVATGTRFPEGEKPGDWLIYTAEHGAFRP